MRHSESQMLPPETVTDTASAASVQSLLAHRDPFLFVEQVEADSELLTARGTHRFDEGNWFFAGHFPGDPIVPGVLLLEMAAQTANVLLGLRAGKTVKAYLVGSGNAAFKAPVLPGETVVALARLTSDPGPRGKAGPGTFFSFRTSIRRGDVLCMRAELTLWWAE